MPDNTKKEECDVCKSYGGNPPPHVCSSPQPPLSDDWEERFDERFPLHEISESNNLWGDYTLFELHDAIIDFIKKEVCKQRLQAQRELTEEWVEIIYKRKQEWHKTCLTDEFTNGRFWEAQEIWEILNARGLLSNNKE